MVEGTLRGEGPPSTMRGMRSPSWLRTQAAVVHSLAPLTLALVLGNRAEDAFRLSMIGAEGDLRVFWSNPLVASITTLALLLLFWPAISAGFEKLRGFGSRRASLEP